MFISLYHYCSICFETLDESTIQHHKLSGEPRQWNRGSETRLEPDRPFHSLPLAIHQISRNGCFWGTLKFPCCWWLWLSHQWQITRLCSPSTAIGFMSNGCALKNHKSLSRSYPVSLSILREGCCWQGKQRYASLLKLYSKKPIIQIEHPHVG